MLACSAWGWSVTAITDVTGQADQRSLRLAWKIAGSIRAAELPPAKALLDFNIAFDRHLGLSLRRPEARRRIYACLRGLVRRRWIEDGARLEVEAIDGPFQLGAIIEHCALALVLPASRPLTPRLVIAALSITPQERLRWTKDGRLPQFGSVMMRRAHPISVATYAVETIAALAGQPAMLASWRAADLESSGQATG